LRKAALWLTGGEDEKIEEGDTDRVDDGVDDESGNEAMLRMKNLSQSSALKYCLHGLRFMQCC